MAPAKRKPTARADPPEDSSDTDDRREETPPERPTLLERIKTMSIEDLIALLREGELESGSEEWEKVQHRVRMYEAMIGLEALQRKRGRAEDEDNDADTETAQPRQKRTEVKYTNIAKLTPRTTPRKFAEWKNDMKRLFRGAPEKYRLSSMKMVAAHEHMDEKAKSLWASHERLHPEDEDNWDKFLQWATGLIAQGADLITTVWQEYAAATQGKDQSPQDFDAYLSSLEALMAEMPEEARAQNFFSKLQPELRGQIQVSGRAEMPTTRQEMVTFAHRVWHGLRYTKAPATDFQGQSRRGDHSSRGGHNGRGDHSGRGYHGGQEDYGSDRADRSHDYQWPSQPSRGRGQSYRGRGRGRGGSSNHTNHSDSHTNGGQDDHDATRTTNKYPSGSNERGELCCYKCGSTTHFARWCDDSGPVKVKDERARPAKNGNERVGKPKDKPHVNAVRAQELSDSSLTDSDDEC